MNQINGERRDKENLAGCAAPGFEQSWWKNSSLVCHQSSDEGVKLNYFDLFWISRELKLWEYFRSGSCCFQHPSTQQKMRFRGRIGCGWPGLAVPGCSWHRDQPGHSCSSQGHFVTPRDGNSVGTALAWLRFDLSSAQADLSLFAGNVRSVCSRENPLGFSTNPLPNCAAERRNVGIYWCSD